MRVHELLSITNPDWPVYKEICASVKFNLGDVEDAEKMRAVASNQINPLPAPISLFQLQLTDTQTQLFLAKETTKGSIWCGWSVDGGAWEMSPYEVLMEQGCGVSIRRIDDRPMNDSEQAARPCQNFALGCVAVNQVIEVFSCCNVSTEEHFPPKFINAKRAKKGKVPFFSYRTLCIKWGESSIAGDSQNGTHASPRLHLRRGHIRTLADSRKIWVRASLVGDKSKGFAGKDYAVKLTEH